MAERPLYTLYKNLKAQNYDVPDDYNKFESALTRDGKGGADNRHAIYENLKAQNFDVPSTYERFYSALFEPRSRTSSRAKGGSVPMSAADRARFSARTAAILSSANNAVRQAKRNIQNKLGQAKKFDGGRVTPRLKNPLQNQNVQKNEFNYNSTTGKTGTYTTTDGVEFDNEYDAAQYQNQLDKQGQQYINAVNAGDIPSVFDVRDKKGNYDLQENIGKNGTYLTEEGAQKQFDKKLADAYARKKEIEAAIAEDHRLHGNPLLSYGASIGASNGRTAEQSDYSNKLATSLALVKQQIGALEAVKQYPTSSWGEDALKALDNTAFTAKTWDFGLTDFATMGQMERIKTKMDNKIPLSGSDKMLLKSKLGADAAAALEDEKMGNIYRWTKIAGQSLPFMADFFLTGGYGGITKGISRGALKFAAKRGMGKVSAAILKNTGIVAGDVIGSYAMAGTEQALKTGADIMQRHLGNLYQDEKGDYKFGTFDENGNLLHEGGESIGTALYKGMTSAMVENYTEKLFGHNYGIKKGAVNFMEKHGMNASAEFFKNIGKSGWYTNSKKWMEKFGINGFGEEVMEEEIGIPLHALLDGDNKFSDLLDTKQQLDIIGGMAISVGSMYAMGAGSRPVKGIYNRAQYYRFRNKVNVADTDAQNLMGDNWADIKDKIDNATNEQMGGVLSDILRQRDTMTKEQINAAVNYGINLMKMRGYNIAKTAEMNAKEITNEPTTPEEQHQADIDNAYSEGHDADDADKHDIQIQQEDQMKTLAAALGISEQQLSAMSDEELESLTGQDDKLDQAIYDYQLSSARYQGVVDDAQDKVDLAAHQAEQRVDMYTDQSRGSVRNATIKASGGLEDYGVYIISGNIATHDDGSIDVSNSDGMILYYDPTTNSVEHADALMFAELGEELPADDVKAQAVADAKENAIKEVAGIIDGTVEVGSQFNVTDTDGTEHTYEVLADYGDGTAAISIDGNVVENPYSLADLQQMKDLEDQKRLEAAKAEREQMEKERAAQQTQETEQTQPSFDFNQILNDNGNVVLVDVLDKDGNTKYPDSRLFLIRDAGAKAKVVELKSDGTIVPHAVNKEDVATISSMSLDEYKQAMPESSMIEDNSGEESDEDSQLANLGLPKGSEIWMSGDGFGRPKENTQSKVVGIDEQGSIILEDKDGKKWSASFDYINNHRELPPLDENTNIVNEENNQSESNAEENTPAPEQTPAMTLEDGTIVPMLEDGNPDFSKLTAAQTAELYDTQFGDDADSIVSGYVSDAKKALDKASNMTVKGKTFVEQKAAKDAKEKAIADAQAAYDSAIAIRDAYNERQLAKVEDTAEGRKKLIEKARRKFARLKSAVKDDAEAVSQLYRETIGSLLHRLYDSTGIDVTDTTPLTAEEYVASNLGAHSLNYEGTETSKGVKQETGLSREDFAKTQLLAADGKGTTIDALVHSLWENRPSNLESLDTQDIRNALIGVLNSGFKASEARNFVENIRIAQAENILEEQKRAQENATYAEQHKAEPEAELQAKSDEKAELKAKSETKLDNESDNESNDLDNDLDNEKTNDKINENINENINVPEDATDENPLGAERDESDLPFSAKENGKQQTTAKRAADVEKNKVDDMKVVDNIVGQKTRKAFERLAKMMGANIQWQYSDKLGNGWIQETTDADGNVHRTIFITLDSSITEGAQFIFGHEMTHQIKNLNPAAYNELTQLVLDTYGSDAFDKAVDETMQRYSDAGFSGRARDYYAEEVVADSVGEMIRDLNLAHTLAMKMSHPLLAAIHEILQKIKLAFFGTEYSDVTKNIIRSIEQAYVKTANGEVTNSETGEDVSFSLRQKPEPKKKGIGYKVFVLKDGKLYPPMVANPDGAATPVGVWLDADAAPIAGESKTGRPQVKQGGKGTQGGSGKLAYRPGWHLGVVPYAIQFNRKDAEGNKTLFPKNFVFAEVEYAADVDYQEEARQEGINPSGKYQHSLAGLKHLPTDGYYMYRTNPNPETDPWVITGAMKVNRILTRAEQADLVSKAGREPQQIQEGDIVTDDVVNSINQEIADAPKFSLKVYHGSGADFTEFDFDHMGEGAGSQVFGWGGYVTSSKKIGKSYATLMDNDPSKAYYRIQRSNGTRFAKKYPTLESFLHGDKQIAMNDKFTEQEKIDFYNEMKKLAEPYHNLYEVDIPEDNGSNYLEWEKKPSDEVATKIIEGLYGLDAKTLDDMASKDIVFRTLLYDYIKNADKEQMIPILVKTHALTRGTTYDNGNVEDDIRFVYNRLSRWMGSPKAASQFLSSLGFTGIKYPAGTIMGGAEENDTNYVIFKPEDMKITQHTKFSLKSKPVRFEAGKKLSDEEKKEVLSTLKDAYKVNGVPYHIEETTGGKEKRVYEPTADSYVVSDITNRPLRYYITLPDGRVAHPTEVYPNISDNEVKSSATKQGLLDDEADQIVSAAIGNMKDIADNAKAIEVLTELQNLQHETHDVGYGLNNAQSYNYKTGIFTSDAAQAIDYVVRRMRRKEDVPAEIPAALKKAVADSYGMVDNLIDGMSSTKVSLKDIKPVGKNQFGDVYDQFKGKPKEAFDFLLENKDGYLKGVFHRDEIGDIDLAYGSAPNPYKGKGLAHIIRKHVETLHDFHSVDDAINTITDVISNGVVKDGSIPNTYDIENGDYRVVVAADKNGNWVLTAFDYVNPTKKKKKGTATALPPSQSSDGAGAVAPNLSAAKIDNSSETAKENGEKFSLKDEKTMFGMHNISIDKLRKAIKQGGFAAPSMGVIDSKNGIYSGYGEITLIPKAEKIAKRTGKNIGTYAADAWTPIYPPVEKKFGGNGGDVAYDDIESVPKEMQPLTRNAINSFMDGREANGLAYLYLQEKGKAPELVHVEGKYPKELHDEVKGILGKLNGIYNTTDEQKEKLLDLFIREVYDGNKEEFDNDIKKFIKKDEEFIKKRPNSNIAKNKQLDVDWMKEHGYDYGALSRFVDGILRDVETSGKVDENATMKAAQQYIQDKGMKEDFDSWKEKLNDRYNVEEVIFAGYKPDGNRKYLPNTVENAVKVMKQDGKNASVGSASFSHFVASILKPMGTLDQIRKKKGNLTGNYEDVEKFQEKWQPVYDELADKMQPDAEPFESYGMDRLEEVATQKNPKKYAKEEYGVDLTDEDINKLNELIEAVKNDKPSIYFETKFMRPYGLDEFEKAIVPNDTPSDVVDALKMAGIDVSSYERGNAEDRQKVTMDAINSSDNIRFSLKEEKEKIVADAKANGTYMTAPNGEKTKLDAEQWATVRTTNFKNWFGDWENDPENASKVVDENGEPMVVWHGRSAEFNTFEKKEGVRFIMGLEDKVKAEGFFFSPDKGLAEEFASNSSRHRGGKANVVPCFLNIRRPMDLTGEDYDRIYEDVTGWEYMVGMDTQDNLWGIMDEEGMADKIKEKGYDGAIFVEEVDDSYEPTKISYCALDANQIKSAENNNGDFSADNNDIRFSLKSMMDKPEGWKQANKKAIHIAEAIERDPKFSLKNLDGSLIKAGTYFSGGGLVEEGLKGIIDPVVAVEYDEKISGVYRNNFGQHIVTADVRDVDPRELVKQIDGEVEYFHASPVCKNYSQAKSNHAEVELDKETAASTAEFINAIKPKVVTIENVKGYKDSDAMKTITDALDANGYTWDADVYNAADYGGYTNRERLIVRAVRDGKLPEKPKKMAHKSGWYEAVADIIPTLTEKKNGVAPWMDIRLKADGIDWRNIDKPLYVMGSAYADGKVPHAFADELLPTLRTKSGDVIVMPDGKVYRAMGRVLARVSGVSDDYKMPFSENLSHTIIGNGIPTQLTEHVIAPLLTGSDPKFSIRTYHGTGASFDKFDLSHALEGEGSESFGHGVYVTNSSKIGREYAQRAKQRKMADLYKNMRYPDGVKGDIFKRRVFGEMVNDVATGGSVASAKEFAKKRVGADANDIQRTLENLKDREKGTEYEQNLKDRLAEYKEGLKWIDSLDEDYLTQGNANRYDVDIPDDNGDYLDWENKLKKSHLNKVNKELARIGKEPIETIYPSRVDGKVRGQDLYDELSAMLGSKEAAGKLLSDAGFVGIKYPAGTIYGGAKEGDYNYVIFDENNANIVGNTRFSLRYDQFEHDLNQWKKDNNLPKDAQRPTIPQRNAGESAVDFLRRVDEYRKQMALWKTAPTYEQHLLSDDTALGEFNRELQRGSVLKRIAFQDSMLAIRKAQEAIMKEVGVDRLNMAEDAYTAENSSHGKGKNEFEEYNNEFLQPLRKAYHQMKKILGDSYDNVRIYMMAKHGLERDAQMAFKKSLEADYEDVAQRSAAYKAYKGDMNRIINDSDLEFGRVDFTTWRQRDNALRVKYSPSYMDYRYDKNGIAYDYSGLSAIFDGSDFEEAAHKLVKDIESKYVAETHDLWDATNAATKKILRDGYKAGMMSKDTYQYVRDMYSHYIPLRGWDGTTADQVWDYIGGGKGAFNQTLKTAHGRTSIADDPIAYIENMAESGILLNNKNWVKQHLMLLAQNHPTSLLTLSKAWYVKSVDDNGNEEWIPATPQITSQMDSNQVKVAIDAFEKKMEKMAQTGDATQKREGLNIAYPQTHSEEREHEVRVMKDGEEYVIYVNGDPQLAQAMNNTRAHRVREIQSGKLDRAAAWLGRKMAAAYTSLSPLFIPSNYFRDLTMTLASTAIREDAKYNYLLRKNLATSWNLGFMLRDYQNGKLREKVSNGNATQKEQMFYDFMMNGGETGFVSSLDVEDLKKKFKNDLKDLDRWKTNPVKVGHTIMDGIEFLNRAIEDSNRFAVYMTSIQYGRSIDEAVNDAKDVTLNFNRKGTGEYGWQMVRNLYLFINPAVQSLQTLGALAKHHPFKFTAVTALWLVSGVLVPIVNAALMNLFGGDDDKDKYWQFTKWDRRNNLIMWVPFTHEYVKIPLAQEFRAFYGVGDMIASKIMGGELAEESWSQYAEDLLGQVVDMLPLDPTGYDGNIAVSLMPNAIRPVFELAFNVDFTGKPLFKETEYNKYDPNFTKAYVGTPDWLVRASKMVNSIGNDYPDVQQNSIDAFGDPKYNLNNPAVVDHVLSSYLGGAYTMGSQVLGVLTKSLNDPKEIKVADIPLVSKFVSNPDDRPVTKKQGDEFWSMKENHDRAANTLSKLKKQAKVDGDYSMLERFYGSEEYKQYKQDDAKVKKYEEDKKKERAEESGEEYRPHKLNAEDIYKAHATPKDDFEDLKLKQLYTKLNGFKTSYDLLVDTAPSQSDGYYNTNKAAIDAIDEISLDKQEISELKEGFLDDGKDAYNAEDMKQIRDLRKKILAVLEKANKVVVANQKAKAEK
jgi:site-specific DNA-cytosine methylase